MPEVVTAVRAEIITNNGRVRKLNLSYYSFKAMLNRRLFNARQIKITGLVKNNIQMVIQDGQYKTQITTRTKTYFLPEIFYNQYMQQESYLMSLVGKTYEL